MKIPPSLAGIVGSGFSPRDPRSRRKRRGTDTGTPRSGRRTTKRTAIAGAALAGLPLGLAAATLVPLSASGFGTTCDQKGTSIVGTPGDDVLEGTSGNDVITGLGGDDTIRGGGGDDLIDGGAGNDTIHGGSGNDCLRGGKGSDHVDGDKGSDTLRGNRGADDLYGGKGSDDLDGGTGKDYLDGEGGSNVCNADDTVAKVKYLVGNVAYC